MQFDLVRLPAARRGGDSNRALRRLHPTPVSREYGQRIALGEHSVTTIGVTPIGRHVEVVGRTAGVRPFAVFGYRVFFKREIRVVKISGHARRGECA